MYEHNFFVSNSIQLKIAIMHRLLTYLIVIIKLVVKSNVIQIKNQSRNLAMQLSLVNFCGEGHISHGLNSMTVHQRTTQ
jgi:hypothetical protein